MLEITEEQDAKIQELGRSLNHKINQQIKMNGLLKEQERNPIISFIVSMSVFVLIISILASYCIAISV